LSAAQTLIDDGFNVMVYTSDDPIVAKELENIGCCAIMPLASLIGSGQGLLIIPTYAKVSTYYKRLISCLILAQPKPMGRLIPKRLSKGCYVRIQLSTWEYLSLAEVQVTGVIFF
jgi:hypothetical protein